MKKRKLQIKSLYIKWIFLFTALIMIAQLFTYSLVYSFIVPDVVASLEEKLKRKAELIQSLYMQGLTVTDETLADIGDADIYFYLLDNSTEDSQELDEYGKMISLNMLQKAVNGEIVFSHYKYMPFCLVAVNDRVALLTLNMRDNELTTFVMGMQRTIIMSALIGSVLIVTALIVIIKPIKKVSAATREVATGNFDVRLKTKSVDEIGQLVENFNLMTIELQKNEYLKKDFVSSVSHEFKTPITSIEGFAKLLKTDGLTSEQSDEYTDIIIKETERLSKLSSNLLKLSLLDSSGFEPSKSQFYLDEQIRNVILLLENQWAEKRIELDIELEEILFYGNQELLSQVWINLIQNAVKFSPVNGKIIIGLEKTDQSVIFSVSDQGPGISEEQSDKIFDRFYKADKSRSREGSGLGLSIVKRIVEISRGRVFFKKNTGRGVCFYVCLPDDKPK